MNEEAQQHIYQIKIAKARYSSGSITLTELHKVVDAYINYVVAKVGKTKAKGFTRTQILRSF